MVAVNHQDAEAPLPAPAHLDTLQRPKVGQGVGELVAMVALKVVLAVVELDGGALAWKWHVKEMTVSQSVLAIPGRGDKVTRQCGASAQQPQQQQPHACAQQRAASKLSTTR